MPVRRCSDGTGSICLPVETVRGSGLVYMRRSRALGRYKAIRQPSSKAACSQHVLLAETVRTRLAPRAPADPVCRARTVQTETLLIHAARLALLLPGVIGTGRVGVAMPQMTRNHAQLVGVFT